MGQTYMVTVGDKAYGPYTLEQMRGFVAEGRVVASSLIAPSGNTRAHPADIDPLLGPLFGQAQPQGLRQTPNSTPPITHSEPRKFGRNIDASEGETSHFIILADIKSHSMHGLEEAIFGLGVGMPLLPQVWLLTSTKSLNAVRNALVAKLGSLDMLFVVDTTHDKSAWYNFGPEMDARIRQVWKKPDQLARVE